MPLMRGVTRTAVKETVREVKKKHKESGELKIT
jgi:hypothetical protein